MYSEFSAVFDPDGFRERSGQLQKTAFMQYQSPEESHMHLDIRRHGLVAMSAVPLPSRDECVTRGRF